ncbi:hypothetical protein FAT84_10675 [Klebsiella pneumoniae subsp. pneumoniae]|nr:hypothetical protein FAT64_10835 [Klebsiella pneumoniae subsp. pneumoniae]THT04692.1 hypothetical protein FAT83_11115 [Klebsiella pneumoniae]THS97734.1 hypothetical protein FAT94_10185 [Klebsiella pneumoniae subsp. pneumoniae]THT05746.1 hypothetical protein FAT91_10645 [Klebsiella pneumoniae]THT20913.1 hypothetical protein FAT86_07105 [Klebsiella pneumoniae subsp. pneumoniae]
MFEGCPDKRNHGFTIARTSAVITHHRQAPESHAGNLQRAELQRISPNRSKVYIISSSTHSGFNAA